MSVKSLIIGQEKIPSKLYSNPNLLIGWDFTNPINRNGQTEYTKNGYTIDRWRMLSINPNSIGRVEIVNDGIILTSGENPNDIYFRQLLDEDLGSYLVGKTVTLSVLAEDVQDGFRFSQFENDESFPIVNGLTTYTFTWITPTKNHGIQIYNRLANISCKVIAAKLELGPVQTLAHQDENGEWVLNEIPSYAEQYAICSQYSPITGEWIGSQHSNINLLENWYLANPVNQRGAASYPPNEYSVDRWWLSNGGSLTVNAGSVRLTRTTAETNTWCQLVQFLDGALDRAITGKTVTYSILTTSGFTSKSIVVPAAAFDESICQIPGTNFGINLFRSDTTSKLSYRIYTRVAAAVGEHIDIIAAKLELGPAQTLAHQDANGNWILNDPPPNPAEELAKCQRYQLQYRTIYSSIGTGVALDATSALIAFKSTPFMRARPAISYNGLYLSGSKYSGDSSIPVTSIKDNPITGGEGGYTAIVRCNGGLSPNDSVVLMLRGNGSYFRYDANL